MRRVDLSFFLLLVCYLPVGVAAQEYEFADLGPGAAIDINNNGDVLVVPAYRARFSDSGPNYVSATVVDASGASRYIRPPAGFTFVTANALNANGQVAGHVYNKGDYDHQATIWDAAGVPTVLPGGGTSAVDINDASTSAIIKWTDSNNIWTPYWFFCTNYCKKMQNISSPYVSHLVMKDGGDQELAGVAVGGVRVGKRAIAWSGSTNPLPHRLMGEPTDSVSPSTPTSINNKEVAVGYAFKKPDVVARGAKAGRALIWRESREPEYLFPDVSSAAYDINDNNLVVGEVEIQAKNHAFLMLPDRSWVDLNDVLPATVKNSGWVLQTAQSINKNGQVVGRAVRNHEARAYRLTPKFALPGTNLSLAVAIPGPHRVNAKTQFDFTVSNLGAAAIDATVVFRMGQSVPLAWLDLVPGCEVANSTELRCRFDGLGVGETRTLTTSAKCLQFGRFDWRAEAAAVAVDSDFSNNTQTGSLEIIRAQSDVAPIYKLRDLGRVNVNDEAFVRINNRGDIVISDTGGAASVSRLIRGVNTVQAWPVGQSVSFLSEQGQVGWDSAGAINVWGDNRFSRPDNLGEKSAFGRGIDENGNLWGTAIGQSGRQKIIVRALDTTVAEIPPPADLGWIALAAVNPGGLAAGYGRVNTGWNVPLAMRVGVEPWRLATGQWSGGEALANSTDGKAAGFVADPGGAARAVWWPRAMELVDLGFLVGSNSRATGVNRNGAVVGIAALETNQQYAFLVRDGQSYDLNNTIYPIPGETWQLIAATALNDDGEIVGIGTRNGERHAFALYPAVNVQVVGAAVGGALQESTKSGTFGSRVTIDGDMMAVGVPDDDAGALEDAGAVYRYRNLGNSWVREGYPMRAPTPQAGAKFGSFLQVAGPLFVIGGEKAAFFSRDFGLPTAVELPASLSASRLRLVATNGEQFFVATGGAGWLQRSPDIGGEVPLPGKSGIIVDGAFTKSNPSELVVATTTSTTTVSPARTTLWAYATSSFREIPKQITEVPSFGGGVVRASASRVALGIPEFKQVYVYRRDGAGWESEDLLSPADGVDNSFGTAFALTDNFLVVGDPDGSYESRASGVVYVYQRHGHAWILETRIGPENGPTAARFGAAIALREFGGEVEVVIGAPGWPATGSAGKGRIFTYRLEKKLPVVDVALTTRAAPLFVNVNHTAEVLFELTNGSTTNTAHNVVVRCVAPPGQLATLVWQKESGTDETATGNLPELTIPILGPARTEQLSCRIALATLGAYSLRAYATVGPDQDDPESANNEVSVTFNVELPKIDLVLEKTGVYSPAYVRRDAPIWFSLKNQSQQNTAHNVVVTCTAPTASALRLTGPSDRITINGAQGVIQSLAPGASLALTCINTEATAGVVDVAVHVTAGNEENDTDPSNNRLAQSLTTVAPGQLTLTILSAQLRNIDKGSQARIEFMLEGRVFQSSGNPSVAIDGMTDANASVQIDPPSGTKGSVLLATSNLARGDHIVQLVWDVTDEAGDLQTLSASTKINVRRAVAVFSGTPQKTHNFDSDIRIAVELDSRQGAGRLDQVYWSLRHVDATETLLKGVTGSGHVEISSGLEVGEYDLALFFEGEENQPDAALRIRIMELGPPTQGPRLEPIPDPAPSSGAIDWTIMAILILGIAHGRRGSLSRAAAAYPSLRAVNPKGAYPTPWAD